MQIYYQKDYARALIEAVGSAQSTVTLATMVMDTEGDMRQVFTALRNAQKRGVIITLYIDSFTKFQTYESLNPIKGQRTYKHLLEHLHALQHDGAHVVWLGKIGLNPYKRRFHQKISIIDDEKIFFAGGINLTGISFTHNDYMLHTVNKKLALTLSAQLKCIHDEDFIEDSSYVINPHNTVLLDGGTPRSSIVYDTALTYAKTAKHIIYVSQMAPTGKLAKILKQKSVTYYLNRPASMSLVGGVSEYITQATYKYHNSYTKKPYIHAKYMLFTMSNGETVALTGSHNFNERGVNYGTKEIALLTKDDTIWQDLYNYTQSAMS